jgi:hypothetical protein
MSRSFVSDAHTAQAGAKKKHVFFLPSPTYPEKRRDGAAARSSLITSSTGGYLSSSSSGAWTCSTDRPQPVKPDREDFHVRIYCDHHVQAALSPWPSSVGYRHGNEPFLLRMRSRAGRLRSLGVVLSTNGQRYRRSCSGRIMDCMIRLIFQISSTDLAMWIWTQSKANTMVQ